MEQYQPRKVNENHLIAPTTSSNTHTINMLNSATPTEQRIDSEILGAIARDALLRYKIDALKREMPEYAALSGLVQRVNAEPVAGIPLSVARQTLYEQYKAAGMEIPYEFIDQAIERAFPSAEKVQRLLGAHQALPTKKILRAQLSDIMNSYAERCINTLEETYPGSTFSYSIRRRFSFPWRMKNERVSFYERSEDDAASVFCQHGKKIAEVIYNNRPSSAFNIQYHSMIIISNRFVVGCDEILKEWRRTIDKYIFDNFPYESHPQSIYGKWKVTYHERVSSISPQ